MTMIMHGGEAGGAGMDGEDLPGPYDASEWNVQETGSGHLPLPDVWLDAPELMTREEAVPALGGLSLLGYAGNNGIPRFNRRRAGL